MPRSHTTTTRCSHCGAAFVPRDLRRPARHCGRRCEGASRRTQTLTGRSLNHKGYVVGKVWRDGRKVTVLEHRWVMEQHLGRRLLREERVHHRDRDRTNNAITNLKLYPNQREHQLAEHPRRRAA